MVREGDWHIGQPTIDRRGSRGGAVADERSGGTEVGSGASALSHAGLTMMRNTPVPAGSKYEVFGSAREIILRRTVSAVGAPATRHCQQHTQLLVYVQMSFAEVL